jgi:hypothetical protein
LVRGGELVVIGGVRPWGTEADVKLEQRQKEVGLNRSIYFGSTI